MKKVLVMGAGLVAAPHVKYLTDRPDFQVTVADIDRDRAEKLIAGRPNASAVKLDVEDQSALESAIGASDLTVSLLPATMHPRVAAVCVARGVHMVTASYVSPAMKQFDGPAKEKGIMLLNEMGLDPGIDHMEAMRVIREVHDVGGKVVSFTSWCGGLPAPEANTNPFGYKFSWSPRGVLVAGKNNARFLKDGKEVVIPAKQLFAHPETIRITDLGDFEGYPNRDSTAYRELYGIQEARNVLRGTLRFPGWCATLKAVFELGLLNETVEDRRGVTAADFTRQTAGLPEGGDLAAAVAARLKIEPGSEIIKKLAWLGLFDEKPVPIEKGGAIDVLTAIMLGRMSYGPGERDMVILQHEFTVEFQDRRAEKTISTLIDYGEPGGNSSMSRTVGYPTAIGARLILEDRIHIPGVQIPVRREIYGPVLEELDNLGIRFIESKRQV